MKEKGIIILQGKVAKVTGPVTAEDAPPTPEPKPKSMSGLRGSSTDLVYFYDEKHGWMNRARMIHISETEKLKEAYERFKTEQFLKGRVVFSSTPMAKNNYFHKLWKEAENKEVIPDEFFAAVLEQAEFHSDIVTLYKALNGGRLYPYEAYINHQDKAIRRAMMSELETRRAMSEFANKVYEKR